MQDTAGSDKYELMSRTYLRDAKATIICFGTENAFVLFIFLLFNVLLHLDLTDQLSYEKCKVWVARVREAEKVTDE